MPVTRFTSLDEARRALWRGDPERLAARIRFVWGSSMRMTPRMIPRGLRKFRSIEEAQAERAAWVRRRVEALRSRVVER